MSRMPKRLPTLVWLPLVFACGGGDRGTSSPTPGAPGATPTPAAVRVAVQSTPLPPASAGATPRHGGLVEKAGSHWVELTVTGGRAIIYLYDESLAPLPAEAVKGTMTLTTESGTATAVEIKPETVGGVAALAGGKDLPQRFLASIQLDIAGSSAAAEIRYATLGTPGTWADPEPVASPSPR